MRRMLAFVVVFAVSFFCMAANGGTINPPNANPSMPDAYLFVDAAPNFYGSPDFASWKKAAFAAAARGTFVNMQNSVIPDNAGTTNFEIEDEVAYSFGDLGKRLTWIFWIPGHSQAELSIDDNCQISLFYTRDGFPLDFYQALFDSTWLMPTHWQDYDADGDGIADGVIGFFGMGWWGAPGVNTPEALVADLQRWSIAQEIWQFNVKLFGKIYSITSNRIPIKLASL
jgi:hypothetical protein